MATYEIVTADSPHRGADWNNEVGEHNEFATIAEAEAGIASLRELGGEWADGIYAVREVGERYPELGTISEPATTYALYQHSTTGERYAAEIMDATISRVCGPLNLRDLDAIGYDYERAGDTSYKPGTLPGLATLNYDDAADWLTDEIDAGNARMIADA